MPSIIGVGTALPENFYPVEDLISSATIWLQNDPERLKLFKKFLASSNAETRSFIISPSDILNLGGLENRATLFEEYAAPLGSLALSSALQIAGELPDSINNLIFTSCSCPSIPAVDALIVDKLKLSRTINRVPIYQHGCAGGVVGLRLAAELCKVQGLAAVTSVELCSLVFQRDNPSGAQLVGSAIFADGAAAVLVSPEDKGLVIRGSQSFLIPNSRHFMGYDIYDDGFHLRLDKNLPQALLEIAPSRIQKFLELFGLEPQQIACWLFHPGGTKILDFLESTLAIEPHQLSWAREVLSNIGNLSSATVLFVLKRFLDSKCYKNGDKIVMLGVGPGLTLELILFESN